MKRLLLLALLSVVWASTASAAIFVSLIGTVEQTPGVWTWSYGLFLEPDEVMRVGDFATIYDFPNPIGAPLFGLSAAPEVHSPNRTFLTTVQNIGLNPPSTGNPDDPNIPNVTVKLTGGGDIVPHGPGPTTIGNLFVKANTDAFVQGTYAASAAKRVVDPGDPTKFIAGDQVSNGGFVPVPAVIPEPGSIVLMLVGLVALGAVGLRRRSGD